MQKDLIGNLNSDYLEALSALNPKSDPVQILVYVESHDDISFWRYILKNYESQFLKFDINLPFKKNYEKGKHNVIENFKDNLGKFLIICIDSDYDFLLQNTNELSTFINSNRYVFQTYTYSIENLLCYADSLNNLCVNCTKVDQVNIDLKVIIENYCKIIYDLLIWSIYFYKINDFDKFTITDFCNESKLLSNSDIEKGFADDLSKLEMKVKNKLTELESLYFEHVKEIEKLKIELLPLGLNVESSYLFSQGHLILENVILMILKPVCNDLIKTKRALIKEKCIHDTHIGNELNNYKKKIIEIEKAIQINYQFDKSEIYEKIKEDLKRFIEEFS